MRDLRSEELTHVYGAGGKGKRCAPKKHKRKGGSSSRGKRHGSSGRGKGHGSS